MSKTPQDRYETCLKMVEALGKALADPGKPKSLVPATLAELPSYPGALTPQTLTHISIAAAAARPMGAPPAPPGLARPSPALPPRRQERQLFFPRTWTGLGIGCAVLLALGILGLILGSALALSRQLAAGAAGAPTRTRTAAPLPGLVQTPSETQAGQPTETSTAAFELVFLTNKEDSLFIIFRGPGEFPMQPLELKSNLGEIEGVEWGVETLRSGECVTAWKDNKNAKPPEGVQCTEVGERLVRAGPERLWKGNYSVYYEGAFFGECRPELDFCVVSIIP
jgi:hypothetical protein